MNANVRTNKMNRYRFLLTVAFLPIVSLALADGLFIAIEQSSPKLAAWLYDDIRASRKLPNEPISAQNDGEKDNKSRLDSNEVNKVAIAYMLIGGFVLAFVELAWRFSSVLPSGEGKTDVTKTGVKFLIAAVSFFGAGIMLYELPSDFSMFSRSLRIPLSLLYLLAGSGMLLYCVGQFWTQTLDVFLPNPPKPGTNNPMDRSGGSAAS
jgi:hypothetical protein